MHVCVCVCVSVKKRGLSTTNLFISFQIYIASKDKSCLHDVPSIIRGTEVLAETRANRYTVNRHAHKRTTQPKEDLTVNRTLVNILLLLVMCFPLREYIYEC